LVYFRQQQDQQAEKYLLLALGLDPLLGSSHFELAKVYQREGKYAQALVEIDAALKAYPESSSSHYVRGQVLQRLGRTSEARAEMQTVTRILNAAREKRRQEIYPGQLRSSEGQDPQ
jgi:Tfp pilus assembly protein PilF